MKANDDAELDPKHIVAIGRRVRAERERRGMSLRELARRVGVSPSLISQIETGKAQPSVGTLYSLTRALRMSVDQLFAGDGEGDEPSAAEAAEVADHVPGLIVRVRERKVIDLDSGVLTVTVNFDDHVLYPGDSIAFPSTTPHRLWNAGTVPVHAIWVVIGRHRVSGAPPS